MLTSQRTALASDELFLWGGTEKVLISELTAFANYSTDDIVVIGGSIVEGMGNPYSDIDIAVICEQPPVLSSIQPDRALWLRLTSAPDLLRFASTRNPNSAEHVRNTYNLVGKYGTRCDVEYYSFDEIIDWRDKLFAQHRIYGETLERLDLPISSSALRVMHRLLSGKCVHNQEGLARLVPDRFASCLKYVLYRSSMCTLSDAQDLFGSVMRGNAAMTVFLLRQVLFSHLKMASHLAGNTNNNAKWVTTYAPRLLGSDHPIIKQYTALSGSALLNEDDIEEAVDDCLLFCEGVVKFARAKNDTTEGFVPTAQMQRVAEQYLRENKSCDPHALLALEWNSRYWNPRCRSARDILHCPEGLQTLSAWPP